MARNETKYRLTLEDRTKRGLSSAKKGFSSLDKTVAKLATGFAALGGASAMGYVIKQSIETIDQIGKLETRLGASAEALQELKHAGQLTGVEFNTLTMGLQRMTRRVAEAARGTGEAKDALRELNLDARAMSRLAPEDQFMQIARAMESVGNQSDKVRLAMKLFDSEGVALLQTMAGGADELARMREEARALGFVLDRNTVKSVEAANDAMTRLAAKAEGVKLKFVGDLAPSLVRTLETVDTVAGGLVKAFGKVIAFQLMMINGMLTVAVTAWRAVIETVAFVLQKVPKVGEALDGAADKLANLQSQLAANTRGAFLDLIGQSEEFSASIGTAPPKFEAVESAVEGVSEKTKELGALQDEVNAGLTEYVETSRQMFDLYDERMPQMAETARIALGDWMARGLAVLDTLTASLTSGFGAAFTDVIVFGEDAGEAFNNAWKRAIASALDMLSAMVAKLLLIKAIAATLSFLFPASGLGSLVTAAAGASVAPANDVLARGSGGGAGPVIVNFNSLTPAVTSARLDAALAVADSARVRGQYLVGAV